MQPTFTQKIIRSFRIKIVALALVFASLTGVTHSQAVELFNEGFISVVPGGWTIQNNSNPLGQFSWFQGLSEADGAFDANSGDPTSYAGVNYQSGDGTATISNWLISPNVTLRNGDIFTFYTRGLTGGEIFPDRLQVRMSTNGASTDVGVTETSVGDFTTLLLDINPTYDPAVFPEVWTQFTVTISGLAAPISGRLAFRYFVENGGPLGDNSDWIGIDDAIYTTFLPPCAGAPVPGNTISTATTVCPGTFFTLSLENPPIASGITYQWQSSSTLAGTYTDIAGATSLSLTLTQGASTYYRCIETCTTAAASGTSTPVQVLLTPTSGCYCVPPPSMCDQNDEILNVSISNLNNSSSGCTGTGYTDYTSTVDPAQLVSGGANQMIATIGPGAVSFGGFEYVGVWIDYDQNGVFDVNEFTDLGFTALAPITGNIVIPATALPGNTRMRVRVAWSPFGPAFTTGAEACADLIAGFGETEDYAVTIAPCTQGAFTAQPANTSAACGSDAGFTTAASGSLITYQWEQRVNSTAPWTFVTDGGIYSGATTATLSLTSVADSNSGYQYRALINGACTATDFSNIALLTVTPLVATVDPESAAICAGSIGQLTLSNIVSPVKLIDEGFATVDPLPAGWATQNNSNPIGAIGWAQGVPGAFPANSGAPDSYAASDYEAVNDNGTISNWLITPDITLKNGDQFTFYTRAFDGTFPDRLQVRMSTNGVSTDVGTTETSVGDFTTLLLDINPTYSTTVYPEVWTQYTITISGLAAPIDGRLAFRYFVEDGGLSGTHSNYIGIDDVVYTSGGVASGIWSASPATPNTMFTDALATVPYTGTPAHTIYIKPTVNTDYSVVFSSAACTSEPTVIPVIITAPITGLSDPADKDGCIDGSISFNATAVSDGPVTYQWQQLTLDPGAIFENIGAADASSTLTLDGLTLDMTGYKYRVIATAGSCGSDTSAAATLSVFDLPNVSISAPPLQLTPGLSTTVTATSTPAGTNYSWTLNGSAIGATTNPIIVDIDGIGIYNATVTDIHGCVNSSNDLLVSFAASDRLWIYPNPSTGQFQVRLFGLGSPNEKRTVSVFNSAGGLIVKKDFELSNITNPYQKMEFDLSKASPGIYLVKVADNYAKKVVSGFVIIGR